MLALLGLGFYSPPFLNTLEWRSLGEGLRFLPFFCKGKTILIIPGPDLAYEVCPCKPCLRSIKTAPVKFGNLASGGPRLRLEIIEPFFTLAGFQEFLSFPCCLVVRKLFRVEQVGAPQELACFCCFPTMFYKASGHIIGDTDRALAR